MPLLESVPTRRTSSHYPEPEEGVEPDVAATAVPPRAQVDRGTVTSLHEIPGRMHVSAPLRPHRRPPDRAAAERAVADLLRALGRDPSDVHLADTPRRVADAYLEMLTPHEFDLTTFPNDEGYDELVLARDIPIQSLCEHHMLPFKGVAHIGYLPGERILGLSKLARVAEMFARDLQVQERLTQQIAGYLQRVLHPAGVGVVIEAEHECMSLRGVRAHGARTVTSALFGVLRTDDRSRAEFLSLVRSGC